MATKVVNIRIDEELLAWLKERAEKEHRTLSNMIISILSTKKEFIDNDIVSKSVLKGWLNEIGVYGYDKEIDRL